MSKAQLPGYIIALFVFLIFKAEHCYVTILVEYFDLAMLNMPIKGLAKTTHKIVLLLIQTLINVSTPEAIKQYAPQLYEPTEVQNAFSPNAFTAEHAGIKNNSNTSGIVFFYQILGKLYFESYMK